jgi:hypothetical protein
MSVSFNEMRSSGERRPAWRGPPAAALRIAEEKENDLHDREDCNEARVSATMIGDDHTPVQLQNQRDAGGRTENAE